MPDPDDGNNNETIQAVQVSAGGPQRQAPSESFSVMADAAGPTAADLDARQAAMGERRKGGPPLPSGGDMVAFAIAVADSGDEPTEVEEP
jgi:hypothetical protein